MQDNEAKKNSGVASELKVGSVPKISDAANRQDASQVSKSWQELSPRLPLSFILAASNAVKEKNS